MTDFNVRAGRIQLIALVTALLVAVLIAIAITTGAFVLSFAVQRDLARQALVPPELAWIFPAIVDGAILGATIAVVAMSKISGNTAGKRFFLALALAVVAISVYGNAFHAHKAATDLSERIASGFDATFTPLSPTGAALVAVIPPLLVLAFTHGIGVLVKAIGTAYTEHRTALRDSLTTVLADADRTPETTTTVTPATNSAEATHQVDETQSNVNAPSNTTAPAVAQQPSIDTAPPEAALTPRTDDDAAVLRFVEHSELFAADTGVRETAHLYVTEPDLTWRQIAERTQVRSGSTALRRWERAKDAFAETRRTPADRNDRATGERLPEPELVSP